MRLESVQDSHVLDGFVCAEKPLTDWLRRHAKENQRRGLSRTFLLIDDLGEVVGYFSLVMSGVAVPDLPRRFGRGLPDVEIGAVLLARLAVHVERQGQGLGRDMLVAAVERSIQAAEHVSARFLVVDPINETAREFYAHFGFADVGDIGGRMYARLDQLAEALGG